MDLAVFPGSLESMTKKYLNKILNARVYDVVKETPIDHAASLSLRTGNRVLIKREDLQPVFSFKVRGAYTKMLALSDAAREKGVIAASAGNHAQGLALAAKKLGVRATIVMPETTPEIKVNAVAKWGAEIILHGDAYQQAYERAMEILADRRLTFVHPYDDPDVIAGQGARWAWKSCASTWEISMRSSSRWVAAGCCRGSARM
jgi:threonine dehydratase